MQHLINGLGTLQHRAIGLLCSIVGTKKIQENIYNKRFVDFEGPFFLKEEMKVNSLLDHRHELMKHSQQ